MTSPLFYGYPQPPVPYGTRDPVRPWWIRQGMLRHWIRSDGLTAVSYTGKQASVTGPQLEELEEVDVASEDLLAYCDRTWPMAVPPPLAGQVWTHRGRAIVLSETPDEDGFWIEIPTGVLVWGPFAPWAPPDWTPPTSEETPE